MRLFQILHAIVGGMFYVAVVSVIFAPVFHRVLHIFSLEVTGQEEPSE